MTRTRISRRRFLLVAGGGLGAGVLGCAGVMALDTPRPEIKLEEWHSASGTAEARTQALRKGEGLAPVDSWGASSLRLPAAPATVGAPVG